MHPATATESIDIPCCATCGQPLHNRAVDRLTGLLDRWGWDEQAGEALTQAGSRTSVLLVVDLDLFRDINNVHGHLAGDAVLRAVADVIKGAVRQSDVVSRFGGHGGDEFLILLPGITARRGLLVARRIHERIRAAAVTVTSVTGNAAVITGLTASIGVAVNRPGKADPVDLLRRADGALLEAKRLGRDRIAVAAPVPDS